MTRTFGYRNAMVTLALAISIWVGGTVLLTSNSPDHEFITNFAIVILALGGGFCLVVLRVIPLWLTYRGDRLRDVFLPDFRRNAELWQHNLFFYAGILLITVSLGITVANPKPRTRALVQSQAIALPAPPSGQQTSSAPLYAGMPNNWDVQFIPNTASLRDLAERNGSRFNYQLLVNALVRNAPPNDSDMFRMLLDDGAVESLSKSAQLQWAAMESGKNDAVAASVWAIGNDPASWLTASVAKAEPTTPTSASAPSISCERRDSEATSENLFSAEWLCAAAARPDSGFIISVKRGLYATSSQDSEINLFLNTLSTSPLADSACTAKSVGETATNSTPSAKQPH